MAENFADGIRTVEFNTSVEFQLNEQPGKLFPLSGSGANYKGKGAKLIDRFGDVYAQDINTRNGDTKMTDIDVVRRWIVKPPRAGIAIPIDPDDEMSTEVGLEAPLVQATARGIARYRDDKWLQGYYSSAYIGEQGATAVPFKAANVLPVDAGTTGTATGLTLEKLIQMAAMMGGNFVDTEAEMPIILITAKEQADLLRIQQVQNTQFNPLQGAQALQSGKVVEFMGFGFKKAEIGNPRAYQRSSGLTIDTNGNRLLPVFVPSGVHNGTWLGFEGHLDTIPLKNHSDLTTGYSCVATTRVDEDKCYLLTVKES
jgi:hypothetical protein